MYINWLTNNNNNIDNYNNHNNNNNNNNNTIHQDYNNNNNSVGVNYLNQGESSTHIKRFLHSSLTDTEIVHNSNGNMVNNNSFNNHQSSYNIINIVQNCIYRYTSQTSINADVIVEVAHCSTNVRYLAHSTILGMHSGYLRSAIRLDDRLRHPYNPNGRCNVTNTNTTQSNTINRTNHGSSVNEINNGGLSSTVIVNNPNRSDDSVPTIGNSAVVLYLHNVTAEQFSPLLTYMYTGYLDLNCDNIFSVLLATHVLHMPRALEICR